MGAAAMTSLVVALATALGLTPLARRVALRFGIVDHPGPRKIHAETVPYLGGAAILVAFAVAAVPACIRSSDPRLAWVLAVAVAHAGMGLRDDVRVVSGWTKFVVMTGGACALWAVGVRAEPFGWAPIDALVTIAWITGVTNAINFLDNMDGLSAGVSALAGASFAVVSVLADLAAPAVVGASIAGACLGFLWHNRAPARIFMGDAGALFLGSLLASEGLLVQVGGLGGRSIIVAIAVLAVPVLDTLMVCVSRAMRRLSPLHPGRDHTSHRLVLAGIDSRAAVGALWACAGVSGSLAVVIATARPGVSAAVFGAMSVAGAAAGLALLRVDVDGVRTTSDPANG